MDCQTCHISLCVCVMGELFAKVKLLSDEINTYIKSRDCTSSYTYIVLAIMF